jgi:hypothetical protein
MKVDRSGFSRRQVIRSVMGSSLLLPGIVSELMAEGEPAAPLSPLAAKAPHYSAKAKRVIFVFATGGVSHLDTFDPKTATGKENDKFMPTLWPAKPNAHCGTLVTDLFPHMRDMMHEACLVRSMKSAHFDHSEAALGFHTGSATFARPSIGSWVSYGLGTFNANLPSFLVIAPSLPYGGTQVYANDFLPAYHQGTRVIPGETPIENLFPRSQASLQQLELGLMNDLNRAHLAPRQADQTLAARMKAFETAFHMQQEAPAAFDVSQETAETLNLYGLKPGEAKSFGWQCLVARRLAERGVRFIELIDSGSGNNGSGNWDSHGNMDDHLPLARASDGPLAALLTDLKRRGMLDETVVVWCTEFGRTPTKEGAKGRGHHGKCFSIWLAGGGIKGGIVHGETDETGSQSLTEPVLVHDIHATVLHLLGIDHTRLTYRHAGRDFRLTDVHGRVMKEILL